MSGTTPTPLVNDSTQGTRRSGGWAIVLGSVVALVLLVGAEIFFLGKAFATPNDATVSASTSRSGTAEMARTERRIVIAFEGAVTYSTQVGADVRKRGTAKPLSARLIGPKQGQTQFVVVLDEPAPSGGVSVDWNVTGLKGTQATLSDGGWSTEWVVVLTIMIVSLLAALAAFGIAVWRQQAGADGRLDVGPELASFLKVAALLMVAALALIAVMLATDEKSLSGLFALFGTVAGYLAGNRSETRTPRGAGGAGGRPRRRPGRPGDGNGGNGDGGSGPGTRDDSERRSDIVDMTDGFETRSLL